MRDISRTLVDAARACLSTPFYHQGRVAGVGLDCIGLVIHAYKTIGMSIEDQLDYGREPDGKKLQEALLQHGFKRVEEILPGDVLLFRINSEPQHVGMATCEHLMVHAYMPMGRVIESGLGETWLRRMVGIYRLPEEQFPVPPLADEILASDVVASEQNAHKKRNI
jgi:cell wall-associated NlpC family hydrolase